MISLPSMTMGVEEEYLLVDPETRDLAADPSPDFMADCRDLLGDKVSPEFLRSQIEIGTPVCQNIGEVGRELRHLRKTLSVVAENHGLRLLAASTHPFADWDRQLHTNARRYDDLARDFQGTVRRLLICGMHVHVGIEDPDLRIDVMNQVSYFLPHLLALSTSSPFWRGHAMGMCSYRLSVFDGMPRSGVPNRFGSWSEYQRLIDHMVQSGAMEDATKIWWDIRPSARFPTLEVRIPDVCTLVEDSIAIAALYQCLVRMMVRLRQQNLKWREYPRVMIEENRWLAQRYGCRGELIDLGEGRPVPFPKLIDEIIDLVADDATALNSVGEVEHIRTIAARGSSAMRQQAVYDKALADGADNRDAFIAVVDHLTVETVAGLE